MRKRLPSISFKKTLTDIDPPIRRRNLSLSSNYSAQQHPHPDREASTIKTKNLAVSYSKKNKVFLKSEKIKQARDLTKLCQENISEYIQLKNSAKKMKPFDDAERRPSRKSDRETL
jgi:hypothetical protein